MRKYIKIMFAILSFCPFFISAKECDWAAISDKKSLVKNIDWSYEYYLIKDKMYFDITATNVYEDLYVVDKNSGKKYTQSEFKIEKVADNQKLKFEIYSKNCNNEVVGTKEISLPSYNKYYGTEYCKDISEFTYCKKWQTLSSSITESVLKKQTTEYRNSLKESSVEVITYKTNSANFYIFTGLAMLLLIMLLIFIVRERHEKDFI